MPFPEFQDALRQFLNEYSALFMTLGQNLFRAFATILIVWFGIQAALSSAEDRAGFHFSKFVTLILTISFNYFMIFQYSAFFHLITDQGYELANKIAVDLNNEFARNILDTMEKPGLFEIFYALVYLVIYLAITGLSIVTFYVTALGWVAQGICVLLGPVFIPFFIVPQMEWLFWGWLKALMQYSFYPVVANAYLFVFGNLLIHFIDSHPPPYDGARVAVLFFPLVLLLVAFTYGILKIPSLVNSLFTGRSGESALPR